MKEEKTNQPSNIHAEAEGDLLKRSRNTESTGPWQAEAEGDLLSDRPPVPERASGDVTHVSYEPPPPDKHLGAVTIKVDAAPPPQPPNKPTRASMADTHPKIEPPSPDDIDTGELPGQAGEPTIRMARTHTGMTPTAPMPRPVPPPQRPGYIPPHQAAVRPPGGPGGGSPKKPGSPRGRANRPPRNWARTISLSFFTIVAILVFTFILGIVIAVGGYITIASQLPSPEELQNRQTAFVSSHIYDSEGNLLYEIIDPQGGRRTYVTLDEISPHLINATIATEDRNFYSHPGFDPIALMRALYYVLTEGEVVSGASTITQQVARNVLLSPEERVQQTLTRKIREIVLATELTRTYPKDTILEIYLNEVPYGNMTYGIQAAAETYFGVDASELTLAQASFLAGLPQSPTLYDIFTGGYDLAMARHEAVLSLMVEDGYITQAEAVAAATEIRNYEFEEPTFDIAGAPHFVVYVRQVVEELYGSETLYRGAGFNIYTTLDPDLQALAEDAVSEGVAALVDRNATNGALVTIDPSTGHVLAMVGSADYYNDEIDGQVNVALRCRQPGSAIKPLTYLAAFEQDWNPATVVWDVETEYPGIPPYTPVNYDERYHGPMSVRDGLANSYNVPAVEALNYIGVDSLLEMTDRLGVVSLAHPEQYCPDSPYEEPPTYGLALTLGGGEVRLLELTNAFATLANQGTYMTPTPILRIEDSDGNVLVDNSQPEGQQVVSPEHAYLITDILSDTEARCRAFSCPSILELSRPVAVKTGTTNDFRDAWTVGYTPDLVTGVWVGNSDNSSMINLPGAAGAGPIWHNFMEAAHEGLPVRDFERPDGIVEHEVCADSGTSPSEYCPQVTTEIFAEDQPPPDEDQDWYQMVELDAFTGLLANETCQEQVVEELRLVITLERGRQWVQSHPEYFINERYPSGLPLAPVEYCNQSADRPIVTIHEPAQDSAVYGLVTIIGSVRMPNFDHYQAQYGVGEDPQGWGWISGPHLSQVEDGWLAEWDTSGLAPGRYTLRITAFDRSQRPYEARVVVEVTEPSATPSATPTQTPTPSPTLPATGTPTPTAAPTAAPTNTPEPTSAPTATPTPANTPTPTQAPTATPTPSNTATPTPTPTATSTPTATPTPTP